jgi:hypothetical protein
MRDVEVTMTRHAEDNKFQRSRRPFARMMNQDLPVLVAWHLHDRVPPDPATRNRLQRIARERLGVDPLHAEKVHRKMRPISARKSRKRGYGGGQA